MCASQGEGSSQEGLKRFYNLNLVEHVKYVVIFTETQEIDYIDNDEHPYRKGNSKGEVVQEVP